MYRYFAVYSFAMASPLYSRDSRQQFGILVYFDFSEVKQDHWV